MAAGEWVPLHPIAPDLNVNDLRIHERVLTASARRSCRQFATVEANLRHLISVMPRQQLTGLLFEGVLNLLAASLRLDLA